MERDLRSEPEDLVEELGQLIALPHERPPTKGDLLILEAQLVRWLRGLLAPSGT